MMINVNKWKFYHFSIKKVLCLGTEGELDCYYAKLPLVWNEQINF